MLLLRVWSGLQVTAGLLLILTGMVLLPLPIPAGLPLAALGSWMLLRGSRRARRYFLKFSRRHAAVDGRGLWSRLIRWVRRH